VAVREQVEPLFAKWMIDSVADKLESFAPATAQKNINLAILDQIVFSVPLLQEQTEIISRAQQLFTPVTARKDDAPAAGQAAIANVAGARLLSGGGGLIQTTSG
jgi:hypothetical protein